MLSQGKAAVANRLNSSTHYPNDWEIYASADQVAERAVERVLEISKQSIKTNGAFHLVTAGGTTPLKIYQHLAALVSQADIDWSKWHIYMGDERCLPKEDSERNSLALQQAWLNSSVIPKQNQHFMPAELGPQEAAKLYEKVVSGVRFDLVLLGMGEDGHTASLFPGHVHKKEGIALVLTEHHSPKPPAKRVSLSQACLSNANYVIKLITGEGKRNALQHWLEGEELPIKQVVGQQTEVLISQDSLP